MSAARPVALGYSLALMQGLENLNDRRPEEDDPQDRKDAADHRKHHSGRCLRGALLGCLPLTPPHLGGLDSQQPRDWNTHLVRLHYRFDEVVKVGYSAAVGHVL